MPLIDSEGTIFEQMLKAKALAKPCVMSTETRPSVSNDTCKLGESTSKLKRKMQEAQARSSPASKPGTSPQAIVRITLPRLRLITPATSMINATNQAAPEIDQPSVLRVVLMA